MNTISLSIIIPLYNAKDWIVPTIDHIVQSLEKTHFDAEIIVIDDGSTDGGADMAHTAKVPKTIQFSVISQKNTGRYLARKHGVELSTKKNVLFIDSRVYIDELSLAYLEQQLQVNEDQVWNGHVNIDKKGNIFARFWDAIVCIAWRRYFTQPRKTSFTIKDFDYYPKGTGFFFTPKPLLVDAMSHFESLTSDLKYSSDDTLLIRYIAERQEINLSPAFSCLYHGRSTFRKFILHAYDRGQFFVDGFLRPGTRFFLPLIVVLSLSLVILGSLVTAPLLSMFVLLCGAVVLVLALLLGALILGVTFADAASLALLGAPFALVYLAGLWRGVVRKISSQLK